jgi:uncharacterized protein
MSKSTSALATEIKTEKLGLDLIKASMIGDIDLVERILAEKDCNINYVDQIGESPLSWACRLGYEKVALKLIESAADFKKPVVSSTKMDLFNRRVSSESYHPDSTTILNIACENGLREVVLRILETDVDVNTKNKFGQTPLHACCARGDLELFEKLIANGAVETIEDIDKKIPLDFAATFGHTKMVMQLIAPERHLEESTISIKGKKTTKLSPLIIAIENSHEDLALELIKSGVSILSIDSQGRDAFFLACCNGLSDLALKLIEKGAKVEQRVSLTDEGGNSVNLLYLACLRRMEDVSLRMIEKGADTKKESNGKTLLHIACERGFSKLALKVLDKFTPKKLANSYILPGIIAKSDFQSAIHDAAKNGLSGVVKQLIKIGVDPNLKDIKTDKTILHISCEESHEELAIFLIKSGVNIKALDNKLQTPLHIACKKKLLEITSLLIALDGGLESKDSEGYTPFQRACESEDYDFIKKILEFGAEIDSEDNEGRTAFFKACGLKQEDLALKLLAEGANINHTDKKGNSILWSLSSAKDNEFIKRLIEKGLNVNILNSSGNTLLHELCIDGKTDEVFNLIALGANHSLKDKYGNTPLFLSIQNNHIELAIKLIEHGVDTNTINSVERAPFHAAVLAGDTNLVSKLSKLISDINSIDNEGSTALHLVCKSGDVNMLAVLIKLGVKVNLPDKSGKTAFDYAVASASTDLLEKLLEYKIVNNTLDDKGETLLFSCFREGNLKMVFTLLKAGADFTLVNKSGSIAFCCAPYDVQLKFLMYRNTSEYIKFIKGSGVVSIITERGQKVSEVKNLKREDVLRLEDEGYIDLEKMLFEASKYSLMPALEAWVIENPEEDITQELDELGRTILHHASSNEVLSFIMDRLGLDEAKICQELMKKDALGKTALEYVAKHEKLMDTLESAIDFTDEMKAILASAGVEHEDMVDPRYAGAASAGIAAGDKVSVGVAEAGSQSALAAEEERSAAYAACARGESASPDESELVASLEHASHHTSVAGEAASPID